MRRIEVSVLVVENVTRPLSSPVYSKMCGSLLTYSMFYGPGEGIHWHPLGCPVGVASGVWVLGLLFWAIQSLYNSNESLAHIASFQWLLPFVTNSFVERITMHS